MRVYDAVSLPPFSCAGMVSGMVQAVSKSLGMEPMSLYMRDIARYELLTVTEEIELSKRIADGDEASFHDMVQANLRLVVKIARRYMNRGVALADLIEEGNMGLIRAVEKFDAMHGCRFSTYATWWIRQSVERAIMNQAHTIRVPVHVSKEYQAAIKHTNCLRSQLGREPDEIEIAEYIGISTRHLQYLMGTAIRAKSADAALHDDGEFTLYDVTADYSAELPDEQMQAILRNEMLQTWMEKLDRKEREVVRLRYGLGVGEEPWTLEMVGEQLGVTRERIRQIQVQALQKLRLIASRHDVDFEEVL